MLCRNLSLFFCILLLAACGSRTNLAPVSERHWQPFSKYQKSYKVQRGDTLYAIAFRYDTDFRRLALINHLHPPYALAVGQLLSLQGIAPASFRPRPARTTTWHNKSVSANKVKYTPKSNRRSSSGWIWPAHGRIIIGFSPTQGKKGINIACGKGEVVRAAASGVVAYAGSGLSGYGNLIIIKHNNEFLTAYGNNARNLVKEGQSVAQGQNIARAGVLDHAYWGVHFEIRKRGVPVNPLNYLQKD